uniref:Putative LOC100568865 [Acyrthosiphon pisum] n=1 Tax=Lepeophtheirus salmonis TaxID=72036 RepID=A0A0K2TE42_LEPSM
MKLLAICMLWETCSPSFYRTIVKEDCLCLPSVSYLRQLSEALNLNTGISSSTNSYLKTRFNSISPGSRKVSLIFDEVYSSQRIEFVGGKFYGSNADDTPQRTVLCFIIKSVVTKYNDIVAMVPIVTINTKVIKECTMSAIKLETEIGFDIVTLVCDGHASNRKFYHQELCEG